MKTIIVAGLTGALVFGWEAAQIAYQAGMLLMGAGPTIVSAQSAPADAPYITQSAVAGLSAEQALSALSNGLLTQTGGVVATYAGATCAAGTATTAVSATGALTCGALPWYDRATVRLWDDMLGEHTTTVGNLIETNSGTGAATASQAVANVHRPGLARATTGTTATGRAALSTAIASQVLASGATFVEWGVNVTTLSTVTERFQLVVGLMDTATAANQVDAVAFVYDEGGVSTGSTAAAYWQTLTASNSTRTFNTSLTQTTVAAATWVKLRIDINSAGTSAEFRINDTLVSTHTANIPTGTARAVGVGLLLIKSIGTTARTVDLDYALFERAGVTR